MDVMFVGPWIINALRPDITQKYSECLEDNTLIPQYIYQCNAQTPRLVIMKLILCTGFSFCYYYFAAVKQRFVH